MPQPQTRLAFPPEPIQHIAEVVCGGWVLSIAIDIAAVEPLRFRPIPEILRLLGLLKQLVHRTIVGSSQRQAQLAADFRDPFAESDRHVSRIIAEQVRRQAVERCSGASQFSEHIGDV